MKDYTPSAALLFLRQVAMATQVKCVTFVRDHGHRLDRGSPYPANGMMNGVAAAIVGSTHALVALGVLPLEAEEALASGADA